MKDIVILYHADCPDGFSAAWAAWKKFGDSAEYIPVHHNMPPPDGLQDKEIYLLDFTYSKEEMGDLIKNNRRVTAIDHHVSSENSIKMTFDHRYSIDNSGAVMAWRYFHPDKPILKMLEYIEDRDLYKFNMPDSRPVCAFIDTFDFDFNTWNSLSSNLEDEAMREDFVKRGEIVVKYESEMVRKIIEENARLVEFEGYETFVVNAAHEFADDIGHALYSKKPPIAIIWRENKNGVNVSLRSDGTVDVSKIAQKFDGGGHRSSAGFNLPTINELPWKKNT